MNKLEQLFQQAQAQEVENTKISSSYTKLSEDPRLIHFKPGNTYKFRLLFVPGEERTVPFINKYTHTYFDEATKQVSYVVCPTSEYMADRRGFKQCPTCEQTSKWYKEGESGSSTSRELYGTFRRQFNGFALVYVINDPVCEENNGTVRIMRYGININKYLKAKIFGIDAKENKVIEGAEPIGIEAFKLQQGRNLIITVTENPVIENGKKKVYPKYDCEFSPKLTDVKITEKEVEEQSKVLRFDEDFYTTSTPEERELFFKQFVLKEDVNSTVNQPTEPPRSVVPQEAIVTETTSTETITESPVSVTENTDSDSGLDLGDLEDIDDIDNLLESIDNEY